jgi:hypothetical protein
MFICSYDLWKFLTKVGKQMLYMLINMNASIHSMKYKFLMCVLTGLGKLPFCGLNQQPRVGGNLLVAIRRFDQKHINFIICSAKEN